MTDENKPLIQDDDRSTQGGPKQGLALIIILGSALLIGLVALLIILFT